jgi:hypothetical protein
VDVALAKPSAGDAHEARLLLEYLTPPSPITGTPAARAASAASRIAFSCGTPTPATIRVVQIEPASTPTVERFILGNTAKARNGATPSRELFIMQITASTDDETIAALDQLKRSIRMAFCGVMQATRLPPMAALSLAATAVGLLYTEVAAARSGDSSCPCGWEPYSAADLEALQTRHSRSQPSRLAPISTLFRSKAMPEGRRA